MQVTETANEGLKRGFTVTIPADDIETRLSTKIGEIAQTIRLPGFRPGKVPTTVVRQRFGAALRDEILDETVKSTAEQLVKDKELRPALQPKIEVTKADQGDLEYTVDLEILPEIAPMDFKSLKLDRPVVEVTDEMITERLDQIAEGNKSYTAVERAAADGDAVLMDFVGRVDGEAFEGGTAEDHQLVLGSNTFIPGFEPQLVGVTAGEEKDVTVSFPEDYGAAHLAGKEAVFTCTVKEVRTAGEATLDDDFAKTLGMDSLDALKTAIKEQVEREHGGVARQKMKRGLLDRLAEAHDFVVPPTLVDLEFDSIWHEIAHEMDQSGESFEDQGTTEEDAKAEYRGIAERRVRLGLLLSEVGRLNGIEVAQDELNRAIIEQARRYPGQEQQVFEMFQQNAQAREQLKAPVLEEKVVDFIVELAEVTEVPTTLDALLADDEEAAAEAKPAKKKTARKKTAAKKAETAEGAEAAVKGDAPAKPKRKRTTKKKAEADEADADAPAADGDA